MEVHLSAVGCRKCPHAADCNAGGLVAFAAAKFVVLYELEPKRNGAVTQTLVGHQHPVHVVRWPANDSEARFLVSGAENGEIIWWALEDGQWRPADVLAGHTHVVHSIDALFHGGSAFVASASADNTVRLWRKSTASPWESLHTISFGSGFALAVALSVLPTTETLLLATAGDDTRINLYTVFMVASSSSPSSSSTITKVASLQGHEDWVRALSFATFPGPLLMLASGSQDSYIRLWAIQPYESSQGAATGSIAEKAEAQLVQHTFTAPETQTTFQVKFDALLVGHDDIVYSTRWHPVVDGTQPRFLLSASMDKTMIVWTPDEESGIWVEAARVGEVGGNTLGLYGGIFGPRGDYILAHGYQGAFHLWASQLAEDSPSPDPLRRHWRPAVALSGHFGAVMDIDWDPSGSYVLSVSEDQTTRIFAHTPKDGQWHELARPQVHGYDMQCVAAITPTVFVSGADEKVLRVFEAPLTFLDTFQNITGISLHGSSRAALGASVPALGLSNKAVFAETLASTIISRPDTNDRLENAVLPFAPARLSAPPFEEHLLQNSLWPETRKLYGHGYELLCLAANHCGTLIASAAKATKPEHAAIRLWSTANWAEVAVLPGHALSVTQLEFSHNDEWLLSGSRDRQWSLFRRSEADPLQYQPHSTMPKAHERIIWSVSWAPDDSLFATGSRDKTVKVWGKANSGDSSAAAPAWVLKGLVCTAAESVTAVAFLPTLVGGRFVIAVGLETGGIALHMSAADLSWSLVFTVPPAMAHCADVTRLRWRPKIEDGSALLASGSRDGFLRIYSLRLSTLSQWICVQVPTHLALYL